ncbi:MAG: tRNA 4-thiouridine(8) synthase ThiI [Candidatus Pacebacteria bacterium]|nr:tRNA 4-thiouridine(8) synthase ThiI [Candidatus Paceibacterota bacterium]
MPKAILLFSGGLDSILAYKILESQRINVVPICFESYFFNCDQAQKSAGNNGFKIKTVDISKAQLDIVKNPRHGRGKHLNPCIDCHLLMLQEAKKIMKREKADFLATGEVLGQRPFSQSGRVFNIAEKKSGMEELIVRPLSAKLLPETNPEKRKLVKRDNFFDFQGKTRKGQLGLAKKFNIRYFPQPAGGCLLTDCQFSKKLENLMEIKPAFTGEDISVLKKGRTFFEKDFFIAVARDQKEGGELAGLKKPKDLLAEPKNFAGPAVLVRFLGQKTKDKKEKALRRAEELIIKYSKKEKMPSNIEIRIL